MKSKIVFLIISILIAVFLYQCSESKKGFEQPDPELLAKGHDLLESNCYSCHSPEHGKEGRIAPPMHAIKMHYSKDSENESEFKSQVISFLKDPSIDKVKMKGAFEKFGLMPKMSFSDQELEAIAHYMYYTEIEKPGFSHKAEQKKHGKKKGEKSYLERGKQIALSTKAILGKNLLTAIKTGGPEHAVEFCNTRAIHLTDSMGQELNANIKRVSDLNRNPENSANEEELAYILETKAKLSKGLEPKPKMSERQGKMIGYYPIISNDMCLKCHGKPKADINQATLDIIATLYPEDKAQGYDTNQLRGIWVIELEK